MAFELSEHARIRCQQRQIPPRVLEVIHDGAFVAKYVEDDGRVSRFHIVRVARRCYWVGIERDEVLVTVIPVGVEGSAAREWFSRRLLSFRHVMPLIEALPVTSTGKLRRERAAELVGRRRAPSAPAWLDGSAVEVGFHAGPAERKEWGMSA